MNPSQFGRYVIQSEIGRGGMATVYQGYDPQFDRPVAIKVLPREFLHDTMFRSRFQREARSIAALEHAAIVPVYDAGEQDGQPYLVMRYMAGGSLSQRIAQGPMSVAQVEQIMERIGSAVDRAHQRGIIHRDIKPGNILFDEYNDAFLTDFGIVKISEATAQLTGTGMVGTPAYMAPEMSQPGGLTPLVDIYALGVTLYQMLTGETPYQADTPIGVMMAHLSSPIPHVHSLRPNLPEDMQVIIEHALAKKPDYRYQSAAELAADLKAVEAGYAVSPPPAPADIETMSAVTPDMYSAVTEPVVESPPEEPFSESTLPATPTPEPAAPMPEPAAPLPVMPEAAPPAPRGKRGWLLPAVITGAVIVVGVVVTVILLSNRPTISSSTVPLAPAMNYAGRGQDLTQQLTQTGAEDILPVYSPDGSKLAFVSSRSGNFEIYLLGAEGQAVQLTSNPADDTQPAFSPNGGRMAFVSDRDGDYEIYVLDENGNVTQLTSNNAQDIYPVYSPDGSKLAFASDRDGDFEIYTLDADGSVTQLTFNGGYDGEPVYSPNGGKLAFVSDRDGNPEIYVLDTKGNVTRMTYNPADDINPVFSPRGSELIFSSNRDGDFEIYILNTDSNLLQLTENHLQDIYPVPSPASGQLVFSRDNNLFRLVPAK